MPKRPHNYPPKFKRRSKAPSKPRTVEYLLEQGTLKQIQEAKERMEELLKYYWEYYSELALQRNRIQDELKQVLIGACIENFSFKNWQRAIKLKYALHPLSTVGSLTYIGGRFNTGMEVNSEVPSFPALYLAADKDTALQETLGQIEMKNSKLTARERALTNPQSQAIVSVSGVLEKVFDLRSSESLEEFVNLIKNFELSSTLEKKAASLFQSKPEAVKTSNKLLETLLEENWRINPAQFDVPANPQIFGHLVLQAGIEGILYPSKLTGKDCLVVFPQNFAVTSSYIALDDEPAHANTPKRVDASNWRVCDLNPRELEGTESKV